MNNDKTVTRPSLTDRAKNIIIAMFVFGSVGIVLGMHFEQTVNAQVLNTAAHVSYKTVAVKN
jgi:hypothetical protein